MSGLLPPEKSVKTDEEKTESLLKRFRHIHGDKYDYGDFKHAYVKVKIPIKCPIHGVFWQMIGSHLRGQGCSKCADAERGKKYTLSNEEFIKRARRVHGDRYDYSKVDYKLSDVHVEIICPDHGSFHQPPGQHLSGFGCRKCSVIKRGESTRKDHDTFIKEAREVHGDKYNYDRAVYQTSHTKVPIVCPIHGEFLQTPNAHIAGQGCPACGGKLQSNTEEFVKKATVKHGDKYDYTDTVYVKAKGLVNITCRKHGEFRQMANNHLSGAGCPKCAPGCIPDTEHYIKRAKKVHGDKYDYSKTVYVNSVTKAIFGCKVHGDFEQNAAEHLRGTGCEKCAVLDRAKQLTLTQEEFVEKATAKHGGIYDYSQSVYTGYANPVKIVCKTHGVFTRMAGKHLGGSGCPVCSSSKGEQQIVSLLSAHGIKYEMQYTIPNQQHKYRYDFYLPDYNLLIEYHGIQHYQPVDFFGGEEGYETIKLRDVMKKSLAASLKYRFIEISYRAYLGLTEEDFEIRLLTMLSKTKLQVGEIT